MAFREKKTSFRKKLQTAFRKKLHCGNSVYHENNKVHK